MNRAEAVEGDRTKRAEYVMTSGLLLSLDHSLLDTVW